jgi:RES domain-containing protein
VPRDLWRVETKIEGVVDLGTAEALAAVGLSAPRPDRSEWPAFQAVGERLHAEGRVALAAPSAARKGGVVLCVFGPPAAAVKVEHHSFERVIEPPVAPRGLRA